MRFFVPFFICLIVVWNAGADTCPSGYITIDNPYVTISETCSGDSIAVGVANSCSGGDSVCWIMEQLRELCGAGITQMKTSAGVDFPLYAMRQTNPSLSVMYNNTTCYMDLEQGKQSGTINVNYNGVVYHMIPN